MAIVDAPEGADALGAHPHFGQSWYQRRQQERLLDFHRATVLELPVEVSP